MNAFVDQDRDLAAEIDALELPEMRSLLSGRKTRSVPKAANGAPTGSEMDIQKSIVSLVRTAYPKAIITKVENETGQAHTNGFAYGRARRASGVTKDFPDLVIFWPGGIVTIPEVKKPGGRVRAGQDAMIARLNAMGFYADIVASLDEAKALFRRAGVIR
ncbi:VRR-NUC domain-containing protein [Roseomonas chloroacetimidivorans]|uniref:VRR-NUC domain-containing protein n=1 Tax=Roseomonas chloroacetimidivorans TaxID=1766656 RepID=UPI003C76DBE8